MIQLAGVWAAFALLVVTLSTSKICSPARFDGIRNNTILVLLNLGTLPEKVTFIHVACSAERACVLGRPLVVGDSSSSILAGLQSAPVWMDTKAAALSVCPSLTNLL